VGTAAPTPDMKFVPDEHAKPRRVYLYAVVGAVAIAALAVVGWWLLPRPPRSGTLGILYKERKDSPAHYRVDADSLPLRAGELVQVEIRLESAGYPVIVFMQPGSGVQIAYPTDFAHQSAVRELHVPAVDRWWQLEPPDGTLTFVLLVAEGPVLDAEFVKQRLLSLGVAPSVEADCMLTLVDGRIESARGQLGRARGIPDLSRTVESKPGMLSELPRAFGDTFSVIRAVAVPQVTVPGAGDRQ